MPAPAHELPTRYVPAEHETGIRSRWDAAGAFVADPDRAGGQRAPFCILIPPPNVTARLHLGHALNNTLQDVLARARRMMGDEVLWLPGTDHAGIATQTVVERRLLAEEGRRRTDFERDEFVARVQAWKDEYEAVITEQLKRMGCSCDWTRQRFTMDPVCARAVREAFFRLFRDDLVYRGKRLVNWDPVTRTALADDEVETIEIDGVFAYLRYPLVHPPADPDRPKDTSPVTWSELARLGYPAAEQAPDGEEPAWVTVATTRPETYLGDTAVAVNPDDPRAAALRGLRVQLPLVGRVIPIIEDDYVVLPDPQSSDPKAQYATGFLKVTPAHDPNDWEIGRRHDLPIINVMAPDGSIAASDGDEHALEPSDVADAHVFLGKSREEARQLVLREFEARGLLEATRPYRHGVGHSYRSHVPIEPYLSDQWYVRVTDDRLRGAALRSLAPEQRTSDVHAAIRGVAGDGGLRFQPARYARTFETWHEQLRDWCISRQLWWGHRIPVWSRSATGGPSAAEIAGRFDAADVVVRADGDLLHVCLRRELPEIEAALEADGFARDPDVLDTWFSSALWPLGTLGWPERTPELDLWNPTDVLCTAREIITLWVSRMVMFNRLFLSPDGGATPGQLPFADVFIHAMIQDGQGQKMSKSLGNGVDPLDIIESHGADALRFVLCEMTTHTQDVRMPVDIVCPHTGAVFEPEMITDDAGRRVAAPIQHCPSDPGKTMVSSYGLASGAARPSADVPLARNTSSRFDKGRNFVTKLFNAARFTIQKLDDAAVRADGLVTLGELSLADRWALSRLRCGVERAETALRGYAFSEYATAMYDLLWRDLCDWYLEIVKPTVGERPAEQAVLRTMLDCVLRLLHPICPFVTEALHERLAEVRTGHLPGIEPTTSSTGLLCTAGWPVVDASWRDEAIEARFERLRELTEAIRQLRSQHQVRPRTRVVLHVDPATAEEIDAGGGVVETLAGVERVTTENPPAGAAPFVLHGIEHAMSNFAEAVDVETLAGQLRDAIGGLEGDVRGLEGRLSNPGYVEKAPAHLVQQTRDQLAQKRSELAAARERLQEIDA